MSQVKLGRACGVWQAGLLCLLAGLTAVSGGCTRRFYRKQADNSVMAILSEKDKDPRWRIGMYSVYPDPRARFADQEKWDRPPMPSDDPMAKLLSPNPQRPPYHQGVTYTEGWGYLRLLEQWDKENREAEKYSKRVKHLDPYAGQDPNSKKLIGPAGPIPPVIYALDTFELKNELAEPVGRAGLLPPEERQPTKKKTPYMLNLTQSLELAQFNSRELQTAREALYLAALPVTLERFSFAAEGYAFNQLFRQYFGPETTSPQNNWVSNTTLGFTKLFSTGALLLMQFANQTVMNFGSVAAGSANFVSQSTINLDIVQPFLQGGGRAVTLEPLTQAERNMLYAVRDYARFRQGFYSFIAVGQATFVVGQAAGVTALPNPTINPASPSFPFANPLVAPVGLSVPVQVTPQSANIASPNPPLGANPTGYLQVLNQKSDQVFARKNLNSYEYFLKLFKVWEKGGLVNPVQVGQIEQRYLAAIENHLAQWVQYRQALDLFRIQIGLPANVNVELDDGPIQPMYDLLDRYENNSIAYSMAINQVGTYDKYEEADKLRQRLHEVLAKSPLVEGLPFQTDAVRRWAAWEKRKPAEVIAQLRDLKTELGKLYDHQADLELKGKELSAAEQQRLGDLGFEIDLGSFEALLRDYDAQPWTKETDQKKRLKKQAELFGAIHRAFAPLLAPAVRERLDQIRSTWPPLPPVFVGETDLLSASDDATLDTVVQVAFNNRLDLMNQRAQLVDAWRKLRVVANSLLGVFNVEYHLQSTTPPGENAPFAFSASRTEHQLFFNSQLPIVRIAERNNYRAALINYQQQRRNWMDALDQIAFAVRFQVRNLRIAAYNYHRIQKRQMELAYMVVDQSLQAFNQPLAPSGGGGNVSPPGGQPSQGDPAALTNQLVNVQANLVGAQNDLIQQWLSYVQSRIGLFRDMGLMPLDSKGIWIDDVSYFHPAGDDLGHLPHFLPSVVPQPYGRELPSAVPPPVPAEPERPEQLPPPARLLRPTLTAPPMP